MNYKVIIPLSNPILILFLYSNIAQHNLVIELCRALKSFIRVFSKLTYSFVAIELLAFFKNPKSEI